MKYAPKGMKSSEQAHVGFYMDADLRHALRVVAAESNVSVSSFVREMIRREVRRRQKGELRSASV
jgi:hypothetical protein